MTMVSAGIAANILAWKLKEDVNDDVKLEEPVVTNGKDEEEENTDVSPAGSPPASPRLNAEKSEDKKAKKDKKEKKKGKKPEASELDEARFHLSSMLAQMVTSPSSATRQGPSSITTPNAGTGKPLLSVFAF